MGTFSSPQGALGTRANMTSCLLRLVRCPWPFPRLAWKALRGAWGPPTPCTLLLIMAVPLHRQVLQLVLTLLLVSLNTHTHTSPYTATPSTCTDKPLFTFHSASNSVVDSGAPSVTPTHICVKL